MRAARGCAVLEGYMYCTMCKAVPYTVQRVLSIKYINYHLCAGTYINLSGVLGVVFLFHIAFV